MDREGWIVFRQRKTDGEVAIPISRELPGFAEGMEIDVPYLHSALDARIDKYMTWTTTTAGNLCSVKATGQWFAAKTILAGIKG